MKKNLLYIVSLFLVLNSASFSQNLVSVQDGKFFALQNWKFSQDMYPKGELVIPKEESWKNIEEVKYSSENDTGNWLIKNELLLKVDNDENKILGLFISNLVTAYEIYWDGNLIARNGKLGINRQTEIPGSFLFNTSLPLHLTRTGKHTLIVRLSNHRNDSVWKWYYCLIEVGYYKDGLEAIQKSFFQPILFIGLLFIPFLFNGFLYFARDRKTEHLLFSLICLITILDSLTASAPVLMNLPTTYIHVQYYVYTLITLLFSIMLPVFFVFFFLLNRKLVIPIVVVNIVIIVLTTLIVELKNIFNVMSITLLIISTIILFWAVKQKKENSVVILLGIIAGWIAYLLNFAFTGLATVMVICVSFSIARQFAKSERKESEAKLKSAHLENELLKKNINPHFLLNTLTSIIAWLRKEPESAAKLVEALALEFRMINQISSLKTIPISQEVELCKTHLQIMNYRKKSNFSLETFGLNEDEQIPPMIFHTLIENGLTHGYETKLNGIFTLTRSERKSGIQYMFVNDGEYDENNQPYSSGFGLNYVKGRLEETFAGRWNIISHPIETGWETIIEIRK